MRCVPVMYAAGRLPPAPRAGLMYVSLARNSYMNVVRRARKLKGGAGTMGRLIVATYF